MISKGSIIQFILLIVIATFIHESQSINLPAFPSISDLPYQAHSYNDVAYIKQLLKRGVKTFKIDVSMANYQSCATNSNWNTSQQCYKTNQYAQQFCCLALRGDASGRNNFEYKFSTMDDFIQMLDEYLTQHPVQKGVLLFAVNHQFGFEMDNMIVQTSIFKLGRLMANHPKLSFAFGSDDFILEYDRVCRNLILPQNQNDLLQQQPLQKLNAQGCNSQRRFIASSPFVLQSGDDNPSDPRDYHGRYRNFNVFYKAILSRCQTGFPSWVKKYLQFPLIFWEPSNERQIQLVLQAFMSDSCRLLHGRGLQGLAITSNIQPQVFEFYLKRVNQSLSAWPMAFKPNNQKVPLPFKSNFLTKIFVNNTNYLVLGQQNPKQQNPSSNILTQNINLQLILFQIDSKGQTVSQKFRKQLPPTKNTVKIVGGNNNIMVIQNNPSTPSQDPTIIATLLNSKFQKITDTQVPNYLDVVFYRGFYYILRQTSNPTQLNILKTEDFSRTSIILSFSMTIQKIKSFTSFLVFEDKDQVMRFLVSGNINTDVWIAEVRSQTTYVSANIAFGSNSKLVLKQSGLIALSMQNGNCNSAVLVNNGDAPLCSFYKVPDWKKMTSVKGTITIIQFTYQNLIKYLEQGSGQPVTPCTPNFVHYKALNGKNVNIVDIWNRLFISSQYVHISNQGLLNSLFCAASNYEQLKNNKKGLLGTIWSRNNLGSNLNDELIVADM